MYVHNIIYVSNHKGGDCMSFADNLKRARKERKLSQEELAELLNVSRQAVSKWEQGVGFPEVEKLLLLSSKLNISLDSLMSNEIKQVCSQSNKHFTGKITITSPHENILTTCYKVQATGKMKGRKKSPQYALFAVSDGNSFWGQPTTFLAWYADKEHISKEIEEIQNAIADGISTYELKYSVKVERHGLWMQIVSD